MIYTKQVLVLRLHTPVGGGVLFIHLRYNTVLQALIHVVASLSVACVVLLGTREDFLDRFCPRTRELKHSYFKKLLDCHNILCLQEVHGKDEFLQALQVFAPNFRLFGTFISDDENAGGSAICIHKDLLPDDATVTHIVSCPGRDHIVRIQSEWTKLVIVNVHFELELTVRRLRGRMRIVTPHWPSAETDFGQTDFGHPYLTDFGQKNLTDFGQP